MTISEQEHTVTAFDDDLRFLMDKISQMGGHAETMVARSVNALSRGDKELAASVIKEDSKLDHLQREVDDHGVLLIARRQPMAHDLREVIGAMRIANDLERIGDLGTNIARRMSEINDIIQPKRLMRGIEYLTGLALQQLKIVLDAYIHKDVEKAVDVWFADEGVDAVYGSLFRELLTYMMEDPRNITMCTHLLFCAKNIERVGDHATNLAETILYVVEGHTDIPSMRDPNRLKVE
jgi:phosphate transport system protein